MTDQRRRDVVIGALLAGLLALGVAGEHLPAFAALRLAIQRSPDMMPSTTVMPDRELKAGMPTVSLAVKASALYDPRTGILANKLKHGKEWERPGTLSIFDGTRLVYAGPVGVRVHGGGSRVTSPRQSFRVYFRKDYGSIEPPSGLVFGPSHTFALKRLIIHNDVRSFGRKGEDRVYWHLTNPLAYDIASAIGCITPATRPARFYLNGEFQGVFVLTEHFDPKDYFKAHFGHPVVLDADEFNQLRAEIDALQPLRMSNVGRLLDLDNVTRWFIAVLFCATGDPYQGPGQFRDPARTEAPWFFVAFDMDNSFHEAEHDTFDSLLVSRRPRRRSDPRAYVIGTLLHEDPEYRDFFKRIWVDVMNFRLTPAFLRERFDFYERIALTYPVEHPEYLSRLRDFLERRPAFVRALAEKKLETGDSQRCLVASTARPILMDGHPVGAGFEAYYFPGMSVTLDVPGKDRSRFSHWRVNGQVVPRTDGPLSLKMDRSMEIAAVWR